MQRLDGIPADPEPFGIAVRRELLRIVLVSPPGDIGGNEHGIRRSKVVRWVDHIFAGAIRPGEAPVDALVGFPEARALKRDFDAREIGNSGERSLLRRGKVVW